MDPINSTDLPPVTPAAPVQDVGMGMPAPVVQAPLGAPAGLPTQPAAPVVHTADGGGPKSSMKMVMLIAGLVGILAVLGGTYYFLSQTSSKITTVQQAQTVDTSDMESLSTETNQIDTTDIQSDFQGVDTDLQSL